MPDIFDQLVLHEGLKLRPYRCPAGKLTIGVGRNLEDRGITKEEAYYLLQHDVDNVRAQLQEYDWFNKLNYVRQKVLLDMGFNLGVPGLLKFKNMIQCLKDCQYVAAGNEMINSLWYRQVEARGPRLVQMMKTGKDYKY